jgi:hypothetical protein
MTGTLMCGFDLFGVGARLDALCFEMEAVLRPKVEPYKIMGGWIVVKSTLIGDIAEELRHQVAAKHLPSPQNLGRHFDLARVKERATPPQPRAEPVEVWPPLLDVRRCSIYGNRHPCVGAAT